MLSIWFACSDVDAAKAVLMRTLSARPAPASKLLQKLAEKGYHPDAAAAALARLQDLVFWTLLIFWLFGHAPPAIMCLWWLSRNTWQRYASLTNAPCHMTFVFSWDQYLLINAVCPSSYMRHVRGYRVMKSLLKYMHDQNGGKVAGLQQGYLW